MATNRAGDVGADYKYYGSAADAAKRVSQINTNAGLNLSQSEINQMARGIASGAATFAGIRQAYGLGEYGGAPAAGGGGGGGGGAAPILPEEKTIDFFAHAQALFPWMPADLLRIYADAWAAEGDPNVALGKMRQSSQYDVHFAGNRRNDGTFRHTEQGYLAQKTSFVNVLREHGIDRQLDFKGLFENEVAAEEFSAGVGAVVQAFREPGGRRYDDLIGEFVDSFTKRGSASLALEDVRNTNTYDSYFDGIKREDGTLRMNEQEYLATKHAYRSRLAAFDINPSLFEQRYNELIRNDVSVQEFDGRLEAVNAGISNNMDQVRQAYSQYWGIDMTPQALLASAIDPQIGRDVLERRIAVSQVGGEAALRGFYRTVTAAERMVQAGVGQEQARGIYSQAQAVLPTWDTLAKRHNDRDSDFGIGEFEDMALGDATQTRRARRNVGAEVSMFSSRGGMFGQAEDGELRGLQRR